MRLVGMMLVVYVQVKHDRQVYDCESESNGTGIMGMMVSSNRKRIFDWRKLFMEAF